MGFEFYVVLERDIGVAGYATILFRFRCGMEPDIARIEETLHLTPLTSFLSCSVEDQVRWNRQYPGAYPQEKPEQWFQPSEALPILKGLLAYFRSHPSIYGAESFIEEIEINRKVLENAQQQNVLFHFAAVPP